jgi:carboxyl-terminal processing protease
LRWQGIGRGLLLLALLSPSVQGAGLDWRTSPLVEDLRVQAKKCEIRHEWARASELYERILSKDRDAPDIKSRYQDCLRRAQQRRRHRDEAYRRHILAMSLSQSMQVYSDVLSKVQSSYVERDKVEFAALFKHGLEEVERALRDEEFCREYLPGVARTRVAVFQEQLHASLANRSIRRGADAEAAVRDAASAAQNALELKPGVLILEFAAGACTGLDEYTYYLTGSQLNELDASWKGEFVGVGITELGSDEGGLIAGQVVPGSSAQRNGLKAGDHIVRIGDRPCAGLGPEAASEMLKGSVDTAIEVVIATGNLSQRTVRLVRQAITVPSLSEPRFLDERLGVAYLQLAVFQETTLAELDVAVAKLQMAGMKVLILDLRANSGGLFDVAVQVAERFLPGGVIVFSQGQGVASKFNSTIQAHSTNVLAVPLVVLVDGETASSAEMLAGAFKDNQRGKLVGETTFGKGTMQKVRKLDALPAAIRVTVAKLYSPLGQSYTGTGVTPHIVVGRPDSPGDIDGDIQLQTALDIARPLAVPHE